MKGIERLDNANNRTLRIETRDDDDFIRFTVNGRNTVNIPFEELREMFCYLGYSLEERKSDLGEALDVSFAKYLSESFSNVGNAINEMTRSIDDSIRSIDLSFNQYPQLAPEQVAIYHPHEN